jgi:uncharacterized protein
MDLFFEKGIIAFNNKNFYDAHEHWEDLWTNYYFKDRLFIQGLIQVAVGYFHITNLNLKGAKGLFNKCLPKLEKFRLSNDRISNIESFIINIKKAKSCVENIDNVKDFNWNYIIELKQINHAS